MTIELVINCDPSTAHNPLDECGYRFKVVGDFVWTFYFVWTLESSTRYCSNHAAKQNFIGELLDQFDNSSLISPL